MLWMSTAISVCGRRTRHALLGDDQMNTGGAGQRWWTDGKKLMQNAKEIE